MHTLARLVWFGHSSQQDGPASSPLTGIEAVGGKKKKTTLTSEILCVCSVSC